MSSNKIIINDQEFPISYSMLIEIADNLPSRKNYAPLAEALIKLGIPSITKSVINHAKLLDMNTLDEIWQTGGVEIRRRLISEKSFLKNLNDTQAQEILDMNDSKMLVSLAEWSEKLYPDGDNEQAMRLSGAMADALINHMRNHSEQYVRSSLMENPDLPAKFRISFHEAVQCGIERPRSLNIPSIGEEDIPVIADLPLDVLEYIAENVEDIEDKSAQKKVINILCNHPDPSVRLALAENSSAPAYAHNILFKDADSDIVLAARENCWEDG